MNQIRKRLTYANVMSSIAVFLVLGGGAAVAANNLGKNSVGTGQIKRNAVKVGKLAPEAVKAGKLSKNAVPTNRLRDNAVSADKIADGSVLTGKIGDGAVTTGKIGDGAVTTGKIGDGAVTTGKIGDGAVTTGKIGDGAVSSAKTDGSIQKSADLLFATVAPATAAAAIVRGRGATSVTRIGAGFYAVTFERDITGCTWLATYGQPNNAGVNAVWATVRGRTNANELGVVLRDDAGVQVDGNGFHASVLCP